MPSKKLFRFWLATVVMFVLAGSSAFPQALTRYREDRILVVPKAGRDQLTAQFHTREKVAVHRRFTRLGNIQVLRVPKGMSAPALVERYRRSGHVKFAELDGYLEPAVAPNDPFFAMGTLWGLNNIRQMSGLGTRTLMRPKHGTFALRLITFS